MKQLIVNADDLGAEEARNAGIFEAITAGAVTSASILANGPALEHAVEKIRALGPADVSYGVHLNLSEGRPVCPDLRLLTGTDGFFLGKKPARELLMRRGDWMLESEIVRELAAQIKELRESGVPLRHLDGHQHVHVFPAVLAAAVRAAREHEIPWMRIPEEAPSFPPGAGAENLREEARIFSSFGAAARPSLEGTGVRAPHHFRGLYLKGSLSWPLLRENLRSLSPGLTELMVHPGRLSRTPVPGPFSGFSTADRELELEALLHPGFGEALAENGIRLTPFPKERS